MDLTLPLAIFTFLCLAGLLTWLTWERPMRIDRDNYKIEPYRRHYRGR